MPLYLIVNINVVIYRTPLDSLLLKNTIDSPSRRGRRCAAIITVPSWPVIP